MTDHTRPSIRDWRLDLRTEPVVRVGIILPEDNAETIHFDLPDAPYELHGDGLTLSSRHAPITASAGGNSIALVAAKKPARVASSWRIEPAMSSQPKRGHGILVRDVVAGRGFHWRKLIDQTLAGALEITRSNGGLVLVNELGLEDYLAGVITAEMSGACPSALLEAQAIVARSWLLAMAEPKHEDDPFDRCNDDCCQRYQGTEDLSEAAIEAIKATRGVVLLDDTGNVVDANYSKSCGGVSELPRHIWDIDKPGLSEIVDAPAGDPAHRFLPVTEADLDDYLSGAWLAGTNVYCSPNVVPEATFGKYLGRVDEHGSYFRWTVRYNRNELEDVLRKRLPGAASLSVLRDIRVVARGVSGRASVVEIVWDDDHGASHTTRLESEYAIRAALHKGFLYSSAFLIDIDRGEDNVPESITLRGAGWGHGAGLCQIGALGMALKGKTGEEICNHYFPTATLGSAYD